MLVKWGRPETALPTNQPIRFHKLTNPMMQGNTEDQSACERELADDTVKLQAQVVSSETTYLNLF